LKGSRVQSNLPTSPTSPTLNARLKRTAESDLDDEVAKDPRVQGESSSSSSTLREPPQGYSRVQGNTQAHAQQNFSLAVDIPPQDTAPLFPAFENRWPSDSSLNNFTGGLSTAVLPQQYSTGLIDERGQRGQERTTQRFPQYWNDYSALGQIDTPYGVPIGGDMVPPSSSTPRSSQTPVYSQEQYELFNNMPPSSNQ